MLVQTDLVCPPSILLGSVMLRGSRLNNLAGTISIQTDS